MLSLGGFQRYGYCKRERAKAVAGDDDEGKEDDDQDDTKW